jgi:hypothetical protein
LHTAISVATAPNHSADNCSRFRVQSQGVDLFSRIACLFADDMQY